MLLGQAASAAVRWLALGVLLLLLASCAGVQPTIPDPATLQTPTKDVVVTERHLDVPHQVLGPADATLGGLREADLAGSADAAKQLLRNAAYTKYGDRLDAVMDVKVTPVTPRGWFASSRGLRVEGVAIAVTPPTAGSADALDLNEAADVATRALISQLQALPSFLGSTDRYGVVIDPMLEAPSGQQTAATRLLEQQVADRLGAYPRLQLLPFQISRLREAQYLLTGTMRRVAPSQDVFQISLALTDTKTGTVVARATARARGTPAMSSGTAAFSAAVSAGSRLYCWKTNPMFLQR